MSNQSIYATPQEVTNINECSFYHTMDIPGHGVVEGLFDLRKGVRNYLGNVDFKGKRVLELGTTDGFLCFYMESQGAEVVAYDLSESYLWDIVPLYNIDYGLRVAEFKETSRKINNSYWFSHRAFQSNAKMVYGTINDIPKGIGMVDISTFGAILQHVRDPFLALQNGLRLTKETVIITEHHSGDLLSRVTTVLGRSLPNARIILDKLHFAAWLSDLFQSPQMKFLPCPRNPDTGTWWDLTPKILIRMIAVLGFEEVKLIYHWQRFRNRPIWLYTIIGHRTKQYYSY